MARLFLLEPQRFMLTTSLHLPARAVVLETDEATPYQVFEPPIDLHTAQGIPDDELQCWPGANQARND